MPAAAPSKTASLLDAARGLGPQIRDGADAAERERRQALPLVAAMADVGLFRMGIPRALGGEEVDPATLIGAVEAVAVADGSAGWCAMIGATTSLVAAYLPDAAAREIYGGDPRVVTGGVFAPSGQALPVDGGYRVSGRWSFASGCQHCSWLMGGCVVLDDGTPRLLPSGIPDARMMIFPAHQAQIIDTWTVSGLRGTGSHDIAVADLFVPADRSVSLITDPPRHAGALYVFPVFGLLALGVAAVALGIARRAIDELIRLASVKTPTGYRKRLCDRPLIQMQLAEAEAMLRSARCFLADTVAEAWQIATTTGAITLAHRALLRLAATHATTTSAKVVDLMYNAGGGTSIYATSPLQRCFRDIHVATQHMLIAPPTYELAGRILFGVETDTAQL